MDGQASIWVGHEDLCNVVNLCTATLGREGGQRRQVGSQAGVR